MRCPACGARNAATAAWCTQCYVAFEPAPPHPSAAADSADPSRPPGVDARIRRSGDRLDWRCVTCDGWNPIETSTCSVCGTPLAETFGGPGDDATPPDVPLATVVLASALLPGAGHVLLGRAPAGIARLVLYLVWAVGGVALLRAAAATGGSFLPALPLLSGALVLLVTSVIEAAALRRGEPTEVLGPRALLWLTVGVLGLTAVALAVAALAVSG